MTDAAVVRPLVSVILPIYNAGAGLAEALAQVAALDYQNVEIIFINDASTDDSGPLIDTYVATDLRAQVLHLDENAGAAQARNLGLERATGEYVWFVDWDDTWSPSILSALVSEAVKEDADLVVCAGVWRTSTGLDLGLTDGTRARRSVNGTTAFDLLLRNRFEGYLWNKLIRRRLLPSAPFPRISTQEDLCVVAATLPRCRRVVSIPDRLYFHVIRDGSLSNSRQPDLANMARARLTVMETALSLPQTRKRRALLTSWDVSYRAARAGTALRLSDAESAAEELRELQRQLPMRHVLGSLLIAPKPAAKAFLMKILGARYVGLRRRFIRARDTIRAVRARKVVPRGRAVPRVVIRTLPLRRGNYGGVLQAFALQKAVGHLGFRVSTDVSEHLHPLSVARKVGSQVLTLVMRRPIGFDARAKKLNSDIERFIAENIATTRLYAFGLFVPPWRFRVYHAMIAGSDQVWRPEYGDVNSYMFDFLPDRSTTLRIAYAASFGEAVADSRVQSFKPLITKFSAVSMRELSAAESCQAAWNIPVAQMPDPTLLLEPTEYETLAGAAAAGPPDEVLAYVLDQSPDVSRLLQSLPDRLGMSVRTIEMPDSDSVGDRKKELTKRPAVEAWLRSIRDARLVITDSFHGTLFAILFNRPFIAIGNRTRGMERFHCLLRQFDLEDRLIEVNQDMDPERFIELLNRVIHDPPPWAQVNAQIAAERERGMDFLRTALSPHGSPHPRR